MNTLDPLLRTHLEPLHRRQRKTQLAWRLTAGWSVIAVVSLLLLSVQRDGGGSSALTLPALLLVGAAATVVIVRRAKRIPPDHRALAQQIEARYPDLNGLLLTAVEQQPVDGELTFLQDRVIQQAVRHSGQNDWRSVVPLSKLLLARLANLLALAACVFILAQLRATPAKPALNNPFSQASTQNGVTVSPGDTSIERGSSLVVMSRFAESLPASVDLVVTPVAGPERRLPLTRSLADPMFGGSIPEVTTNLSYRIEYAGQRTRDFKVTVFEYPRLERSDAEVTYPEYTALTPKRLENTRRLSAVEGSRFDLTLQLNKPVVSARLVAKDNPTNSLVLIVDSNRPMALLRQRPLDASRTYQLQLVDTDGRTNKLTAQFVFEALKNREPELKLATPRGDIRPSALEEVSFDGTAWDDFGVKAFGLAYTRAGQETVYVALGQTVPAKEKRAFQHILRLEDLGVMPDDLLSYFVWADDIGPDGQLRRTTGDLFFAEVRPFEEVFRESQGQPQEESDEERQQREQSGEQAGQGDRPGRLAEQQKQIINATWRLQREAKSVKPAGTPPAQTKPAAPSASKNAAVGKAASAVLSARVRQLLMANTPQVHGQRGPAQSGRGGRTATNSALSQAATKPASPEQYKQDTTVVRDAQSQALEQAQTAQTEQEDARLAAQWEAATKEMEKAIKKLEEAAGSPAALADALAAEQAAYQALLKLQQRQTQVTRARNQQNQRNQSSRQQQRQRQLDQLDLTQEQNRYETQRQAQAPQNQNPQREEQVQVQNRLAELARRQQDVNDRLRELQSSLQEARTEQEREEIRRQLKRLQEEQQQMVADADELQQRMDRPENQSRMAEQRQQMEQARQEMQRAAEAAQQGNTQQALASGTRAQREMQEMRDELRRQNSGEFGEDLRQMRADARDLTRREEDIQRQLDSLNDPQRRTLSDADERKDLLTQLDQQKQRLTNLVDRAAQLSQQTEEAEPLVSRQLYDTIRKFSQDDANNVKQLRDELVSQGMIPQSMVDRMRQTAEQEAAGRTLDTTSDLLRMDLSAQARQAEARARAGLNDLRSGVESAAEKILGDDTEALRLAQQQLDQLTEQLNREVAQNTGGARTNLGAARQGTGTNSPSRPAQGQPGQPSQPGEGRQPQPGEMAQAGEDGQPEPGTEGQQPGQPGSRGQQPGSQRDQQASNQGAQPGQTPGQGQRQGQGQRSGQQARAGGRGQQGDPNAENNQNPDQQQASAQEQGDSPPQAGGQRGGQQRGRGNAGPPRQGGPAQAGRGGQRDGGGGGRDLTDLLAQDTQSPRGGLGPVITGDDYGNWSDQLRAVEEMVDDTYLQNQIATARERARLLRQDFRRDQKKPDWANVQLQVVKPLVEVRNAIADELARRGPKDTLVPIDRDPVPTRYSELVRRYYEELGKEK